MSQTIRTLVIDKRGRKYLTCRIPGKDYPVQLVINSISNSFEPGQTVSLLCKDLTERSGYGVQVRYEPLAIINAADVAAAQQQAKLQRDADRYMGWALDQASQGLASSKTIDQALSLCANLPHMADKLATLKQRIAQNAEAERQEREAQKAEWAAERAKRNTTQAARKSQRALYPLCDLPPLDTPVRRYNSVIVYTDYGKRFRIDGDMPCIWGAHLLGHEGDWGCYCYYREASVAEIAEMEAGEQIATKKRTREETRQESLSGAREQIKANGERPEGKYSPVGETLLDTMDAYGGGEKFIIESDYIWYIQNNGADGANWSWNNIETWGAGAIGWRMAYDETVVAKLRAIEKMI